MSCTIAQKVLPVGMDETAEKDLKPIIKKMCELNDHPVRIVHGWWIIGGRMSSLHHVSRDRLTSTVYYQAPSEIARRQSARSRFGIEKMAQSPQKAKNR
jgi:hypothetical protein